MRNPESQRQGARALNCTGGARPKAASYSAATAMSHLRGATEPARQAESDFPGQSLPAESEEI